jgi:hypothetical protein
MNVVDEKCKGDETLTELSSIVAQCDLSEESYKMVSEMMFQTAVTDMPFDRSDNVTEWVLKWLIFFKVERNLHTCLKEKEMSTKRLQSRIMARAFEGLDATWDENMVESSISHQCCLKSEVIIETVLIDRIFRLDRTPYAYNLSMVDHNLGEKMLITYVKNNFEREITDFMNSNKDIEEFQEIAFRYLDMGDVLWKSEIQSFSEHLFTDEFENSIAHKFPNLANKIFLTETNYITTNFYMFWLQKIIKAYKKSPADLDKFFTLFEVCPNKDVFMEYYLEIAKKRFLHRNVDLELENILLLFIKRSFKGIVDYSCHLYQRLIQEWAFSPWGRDQCTGKLYHSSLMRTTEHDLVRLHPEIESCLEMFKVCYEFEYPSRKVAWMRYYTSCTISTTRGSVQLAAMPASVLLWLCECGGCTISDLATISEVSEKFTTFWMQYLQKHNFVKSQVDDDDGGVKWALNNNDHSTEPLPVPSYKKFINFLGEKGGGGSDPTLREEWCARRRQILVESVITRILKESYKNETTTMEVDDVYCVTSSVVKPMFKLDNALFETSLSRLEEQEYVRLDEDANALAYLP